MSDEYVRVVKKPPERMLFGQFLLEQKRLEGNVLALALYKQSKERLSNHNTRRLGDILLEDYEVFTDREDLEQALIAFKQYKEEMSRVYNDAREIVHEERLASGCVDVDSGEESLEPAFDLGDIDIEELQGYVSVVDSFLEAAEEVSQAIKLRQCAREEMVEVIKRMSSIRQALLSVATKE